MSYIDELRARITAAQPNIQTRQARLNEIASVPAEERTAELETESVALLADQTAELDLVERAQAELAEWEAREARVAAAMAQPVTRTSGDGLQVIRRPESADPLTLNGRDARARAVTEVTESRKFLADDDKANLVRLIEDRSQLGAAVARMALTTISDAYERGWSKYMSGNSLGLTEEERAALSRGFDAYSAEERAMTSGTGSSGGYLVPVFIDPTMIITGTGSINPMRQISTVKTIGPAFGGWYGATAAQVTAAWTAEGSAAPDNTPTITQPNIPVYMAEAFVGVSFQAFEDISDLAGDVAMLFADAKANLEAAAHATGTGSSQPTGVVQAVGAVTASRVSPTTGGTYGVEDTYLLHSALPPRFRGPGSSRAWIGNISTVDRTRRLTMAQNSGNSVWTDLSAGKPAELLGDPIYEASTMSSTYTTGQDVLVYGDFSRYYIIDRIGFTTEFVPNLFDTSTGRPTASRGWLSHWRTGANAVDTNAFRLLRL